MLLVPARGGDMAVRPAGILRVVGVNDQGFLLTDGRMTDEAILREVKRQASFSGPMRRTLCRMLDEVGLNAALGIHRCEAMFIHDPDLLHCTSCIRYPTFYRRNPDDFWRPYNSTPAIDRTPQLLHYLDAVLEPELAAIPEALVIPLGASAQAAVQYLARRGGLNLDRCIMGMPHPSGANNGRITHQFPLVRSEIATKVRAWFR